MPVAVILLAAGQGTRMKSELPKALHPLAGAPLLAHALAAADGLDPARVVVVTGHGGAEVGAALAEIAPGAAVVAQTEQLGTGHAVLQARDALADFDGDVIVLYADTPFVRPETLAAMIEARGAGAGVVALGFEAAEPGGYGRLVTGPDGALEAHVTVGTDPEWSSSLVGAGRTPYDKVRGLKWTPEGLVACGESGLGTDTSAWAMGLTESLGVRFFSAFDAEGASRFLDVADSGDGLVAIGSAWSPFPVGSKTNQYLPWLVKLPRESGALVVDLYGNEPVTNPPQLIQIQR